MALEPFQLNFKTYAQIRAEQEAALQEAEQNPNAIVRLVARNKRVVDAAFPSAQEKRALDIEREYKVAQEAYDAIEWDEGTSDLEKERVRLDMLRRRVGGLDPNLGDQLAQRQLLMTAAEYERARALRQDDAEIDRLKSETDVLKLELGAARRRYENGGSENIGRFVNPKTGETVDRRPDDPVVDTLLKNGWLFKGTAADLLQAEAMKAKGLKPSKVNDSVIRGLQGLQRIASLASKAGALLTDPSGKSVGLETGWLRDPAGIRSWITRAYGDPAMDKKFEEFVMLTDQIRPLFQELAAGNPSDKENEYFNRASPNPQKSTEFNKAVITDWIDYQRDNLRWQYSAMIANNQAVPPEMLQLADTLGVDLFREGGITAEELEARQAGRRERLGQLEAAEAARQQERGKAAGGNPDAEARRRRRDELLGRFRPKE